MLFTVTPSADGERLAVGCANGKFRVFRTEDCQELIQFDIPHGVFCFGDFSPNGQSLAIAAQRDAYVVHGPEMDKLKRLSVAELEEAYCGPVQSSRNK